MQHQLVVRAVSTTCSHADESKLLKVIEAKHLDVQVEAMAVQATAKNLATTQVQHTLMHRLFN